MNQKRKKPSKEVFQVEWELFENAHITENYELKKIAEIHLPFWECQQEVTVETELSPDDFSLLLLQLVQNHFSNHEDICQFLGIKVDSFVTVQINYLLQYGLLEEENSGHYTVTHDGIRFLRNLYRPKHLQTQHFDFVLTSCLRHKGKLNYSFCDLYRPLDGNQSQAKNQQFSQYKMFRTIKDEELDPSIYRIRSRKKESKPYEGFLKKQHVEFSNFFHRQTNSNFYDFKHNTFKTHERSIAFLMFVYENMEQDIKIDIRQYEKTVVKFVNFELEKELSRYVTNHVKDNANFLEG